MTTTKFNEDDIQRLKQFQRSEKAKRAYQTRLDNHNNRKQITPTKNSDEQTISRSRNGKNMNSNNNNNMKKIRNTEYHDLDMNNNNNNNHNNNFDLQRAILQCFSSNMTSGTAPVVTSTSFSSLSSITPTSQSSPMETLHRIEQVLNILSSHSPFASSSSSSSSSSNNCDEKVIQLQTNVPLDLLLNDITIMLIPNKLSRRRLVLQRILHEWFDLRGKCIPPTITSSSTTTNSNLFVDPSTPVWSLEQQQQQRQSSLHDSIQQKSEIGYAANEQYQHQQQQKQFVTKCSINDLGTFVIDKIRNLQKQSTTIYF